MELWDLYDEKRRPLRRRHRRGKPLRAGEYHMVVFVWIFNGRGELLLTKRAPEKQNYPNTWALTGGAALAGESSLHAVARELWEETGINADEAEFDLLTTAWQRERSYFCDIYTLIRDVPLSEITLQAGETCDAKWVDRKQFEAMLSGGEIALPDARRYEMLKDRFSSLF